MLELIEIALINISLENPSKHKRFIKCDREARSTYILSEIGEQHSLRESIGTVLLCFEMSTCEIKANSRLLSIEQSAYYLTFTLFAHGEGP